MSPPKPVHLNVLPPLVQSGHIDKFIESGRTLSASLSPLDNSVAAFVSNAVCICFATLPPPSHLPQAIPQAHQAQIAAYLDDQPIYFVTTDAYPSSERRLVRLRPLFVLSTTDFALTQFITDTLIIFAAFRNLMRSAREQGSEWWVSSSLTAGGVPIRMYQGSRRAMPGDDT
jgi:nuclear pore complex protein Nup85